MKTLLFFVLSFLTVFGIYPSTAMAQKNQVTIGLCIDEYLSYQVNDQNLEIATNYKNGLIIFSNSRIETINKPGGFLVEKPTDIFIVTAFF